MFGLQRSNVFELKKQRAHLLNKAESVLNTAEREKRQMTETESLDYDAAMAGVKAITPKIDAVERVNTLTNRNKEAVPQFAGKQLSAAYTSAFFEMIQTRGEKKTEALAEGFDSEGGYALPSISSALYEGSSSAGGYAVSVPTDDQIVPLAPLETSVRNLSTVIPTAHDVKIPIKASFGNVALKAESGSGTNLFTETDPTLGQFTLSAFMVGGVHTISWEAAQDIPTFQQFVVDDLLSAHAMYTEALYVTGTGSGQPQGLLGNVGAGVTGEVADGSGNLLSIQATFDVLGTLNALYHPGASWLMSRATGVELRKAQMQSNLFAPVFVTVNGKDYLHGYPVAYSSSMPAIAAAATPVLFGDFKRGYVIGERGGAGVNVKILDQPLATAGQLQILAYQRVDGRVRRSEAIQGITLHS